MHQEQEKRFESISGLVSEAVRAVQDMERIAKIHLRTVDNDSSLQAEQLQRIQHLAGTAVSALEKTVALARHGRSYQAQAHSQRSHRTPH
ncbi:hypothetical protein [Alicyclobacillus contaminans]|uniref:hypothetical protein n=1 Tax=Alicyclobacillus contaminans TaxID=392016 RepID=UPI000416EA52|nr:hypothetical protein [Alicyclobacillus contaminans]